MTPGAETLGPLGALAVYAIIKEFMDRRKNGKFTKDIHDELCNGKLTPIREKLDKNESKLDKVHDNVIRLMTAQGVEPVGD